MKIDMHAHLSDLRIYPDYFLTGIKQSLSDKMKDLLPESILDSYINDYIKGSLSDFNCDNLIREMDDSGIDKTVILAADFGYGCENALDIEDVLKIHFEALQRCHGRIIVFSGIDPRRGIKGADLFEKSIRDYEFSGLKLYPPCGFNAGDKMLFPLYEICSKYQIPVLIHTGDSLPGMKKSHDELKGFLTAAQNFPHVCFILGHAAILYSDQYSGLPGIYKNIYLETSGFQRISDQKELIISRLKRLFNECPDNIVFGTDRPIFGTQVQWVSYLESLDGFTEWQKNKLFYENAQVLLSSKKTF